MMTIKNTSPTALDIPIVSYTENSNISVPNNHISLIEGTTKRIYINGSIADTDGYNDIRTVTITFYNTATTNKNCNTDNSDSCYTTILQQNELICGDAGQLPSTACTYSAPINLSSHTDPSTFRAYVSVKDRAGQTDHAESAIVIVDDLLSINVGKIINFGNLSVGSTGKRDLEINNWGNKTADIKAQSTDMTCTVGIIQKELITFNGSSLSSEKEFPDYNLPKQTGFNAGLSTRQTRATVGPISGVEGLCEGIVTFTAF